MSEELPGATDRRSVSPWWGVAAIVIAAVPFAVYPSLVRVPFVIVALVLGAWAVVAAVKTRSRPDRRRASAVLAIVALVAAIVLVVATIAGIVAERERPRLVSIEATGADIMQVEYVANGDQVSQMWGSGDLYGFLSSGTETTVHVTAMIGPAEPLTCKIYIDNELVVQQTSSTDEVTCTYVYPWL